MGENAGKKISELDDYEGGFDAAAEAGAEFPVAFGKGNYKLKVMDILAAIKKVISSLFNRVITVDDNSAATSVQDKGGDITIPLAVTIPLGGASPLQNVTTEPQPLRTFLKSVRSNIDYLFNTKQDILGYTENMLIKNNLISAIPAISKSYMELKTLWEANGLIPGQRYIINDYRTRAFQAIYGGGASYIDGPVAPIICVAKSTSVFAPEAIDLTTGDSLIYSQYRYRTDLHYYAYTTDFGQILRRIDHKRNIDCDFDFLNLKFKWLPRATTSPAWASDTSYARGAKVIYNNNLYASLVNSNLGNNPGDSLLWILLQDSAKPQMFPNEAGNIYDSSFYQRTIGPTTIDHGPQFNASYVEYNIFENLGSVNNMRVKVDNRANRFYCHFHAYARNSEITINEYAWINGIENSRIEYCCRVIADRIRNSIIATLELSVISDAILETSAEYISQSFIRHLERSTCLWVSNCSIYELSHCVLRDVEHVGFCNMRSCEITLARNFLFIGSTSILFNLIFNTYAKDSGYRTLNFSDGFKSQNKYKYYTSRSGDTLSFHYIGVADGLSNPCSVSSGVW